MVNSPFSGLAHWVFRITGINRLLLSALAFTVTSVVTTLNAQNINYVDNSSFEDGSTPTCWAQGDYANNWESRATCINNGTNILHSPDLFDNTVNFFNSGNCANCAGLGGGFSKLSFGAHSGNRYIGIGTYELIQQNIGEVLEEGRIYTFSTYVTLSDQFPSTGSGNCRLKVGLAKSKVQYQNNTTACQNGYTQHEDGAFQDIVTIGTWTLTQSELGVANGWSRITASFQAWANIDSYNWLFIEVDIPGYSENSSDLDGCFADYVFVDDIALQRAEFCSSPCSPNLGTISYGYHVEGVWQPYSLPNIMLTGGNINHPIPLFYILVQNAIGIDFEVFSSTSQSLYHQKAFDPDGLIDPGHPDYFFAWIGYLADGSLLPEDTYVYNLKIWNCDVLSVNVYDHALTYLRGPMDGAVQGTDIIDFELDDCCEDHAYFQNITLGGNYRKDVHDFITAGANVTNGTPGPVLIAPYSNVLFHAGNSINLQPGFSVGSSATLNTVISDCIYGEIKSQRDRGWIRPKSSTVATAIPSLSIYPQPSTDGYVTFSFHGNVENIDSDFYVDIFTADGRLVTSFSNWDGTARTVSLTSGYYVTVLRGTGGRTIERRAFVIAQ